VNLSLLPTTRLHDEQMFIRTIQVFETEYRQVYRCLVRASAAMQVLDVERACAELADATGRVAMSSVLYRVVTTMPRSAFAIIREYTNGRSAIQSRSYRQIDLVCAPQPPSPVADKLPAVEVTSPTLQEAFLAIAPRLPGTEAERLAERLRSLDTSWRAMKRTHWGITLKIIGRVPGTGGTAGAAYLKHASETPLFPALAGRLHEASTG
jgi:tryptophan 2,3-dioxygenase